ncbi:magnesium chelatase subunit D [Acidiphilium acidophilum]|uniref:magnesium chelatase subunit D n=1 Tax=Acidiphilium acidophilum TaxID=76588 RepID=UPI002E8E6B01|nr:magnesium chelatase subunit D [Acidiphilium acidophilum]
MSPMPGPRKPTRDAGLAACLFAIDPVGLGGMVIRSRIGPARDEFIARCRALLPSAMPVRRLPAHISDDRLLGGLDLAATLRSGSRIAATGLLAEIDGGVVVIPMAERLDRALVGKLVASLDRGTVSVARDGVMSVRDARFGVIALDEGIGDEAAPAALADRLAFMLDETMLDDTFVGAFVWPGAGRIAGARRRLARVVVPDGIAAALCGTAAALGIGSLRGTILALRAARAAAALAGRGTVTEADAILAARLILAPRATTLPAPEQQAERQAEPQPEPQTSEAEPRSSTPDEVPEERGEPGRTPEDMADRVLDAARIALPLDLLAALAMHGHTPPARSAGGGAVDRAAGGMRGRPAGVRPGRPGNGARLAVIDTLRAAAPMQRLRRRDRAASAGGPRVMVRAEDFRIKRFIAPVRAVAIFAVDASGSSALNRLAEAKGAIQLLLADCYVRRDQVALIAFRNRAAEVLLPPTGALARARRSLAALPGGGATPLALGIDAARDMALAERHRGARPLIVVLTDGGANIGRDGKPGREAAGRDARGAAQSCAAAGLAAMVIDTAPRRNPFAAELARLMEGRYLPLPFADAAALSHAVRAQAA